MSRKLICAALAAGASLAAAPGFGAEIVLTVEGVRPLGGNLLVSLQNQEQFMGEAYVEGAILPGGQPGPAMTRFADIPPGEYAITVLHDADGNYTMTMVGEAVAEGWGVSGTPPTDRVPTFADARITVPADGAAITIAMMYPQ